MKEELTVLDTLGFEKGDLVVLSGGDGARVVADVDHKQGRLTLRLPKWWEKIGWLYRAVRWVKRQ